MMNEPLERLQWVRKQTGLNAKEFAESVGMTAPGFHNMVARSSRVTRVLANSVELVHGYRAEWILTGEGLRKTDLRERLDPAEQAVLEFTEAFAADGRLSGNYLSRGIEEHRQRQAMDHANWVHKCQLQGEDDIEAKWDEHKRRRIEQQDSLGELRGIIQELQTGGLSQKLVRPLLLAVHFRERWESLRDRSQDFRNIKNLGLEQDFEDALENAQKILKKLDALFALDDEQRAMLENHTMKKGGEWES